MSLSVSFAEPPRTLPISEHPPGIEELRFRRREAGLPIAVLAERLGIGPDTLRWAEDGQLLVSSGFREQWASVLARLEREGETGRRGVQLTIAVLAILGTIIALGLAGVLQA